MTPTDDWCAGCDQVTVESAMEWRSGIYRCFVCLGLADQVPGPGWRYVTGFSKSGRTFRAWLPPKGSTDKPIFF